MPTISTIKPDGTGDYTTLAAWWAAVSGSTDPAQWAEVYSGGGVGGLTWSAMPNATPDATDHPRIYAAAGHGHTGAVPADTDTVAFVDGAIGIGQSFMWLGTKDGEAGEGLYIAANASPLIAEVSASVHRFIEGCLFRDTGTGTVRNIVFCRIFANNVILHFVNNIVSTAAGTDSSGILLVQLGANNAWGGRVEHNTIRSAVDCVGLSLNAPISDGSISANIRNNASFVGSGGAAYSTTFHASETDGLTGIVSNNASSDGTADSVLGGANNENSIAEGDQFVAVASNWALKAGADLIDAGAAAVIGYDAVGTSRPQGSAPDMGAMEFANGGEPPAGINPAVLRRRRARWM